MFHFRVHGEVQCPWWFKCLGFEVRFVEVGKTLVVVVICVLLLFSHVCVWSPRECCLATLRSDSYDLYLLSVSFCDYSDCYDALGMFLVQILRLHWGTHYIYIYYIYSYYIPDH